LVDFTYLGWKITFEWNICLGYLKYFFFK
jgi:hypothetical protein